MTALQAYLAALAPGIDIVAGCTGMSARELRAAGAPNRTGDDLHRPASELAGLRVLALVGAREGKGD